ncbi:MAG: N-acetylmuramoyl-L-alanine amidase [Rhizobiales bacterium]|nr:N-acetylmuramoyl-L-alanine amidase [Hyphomicrobiales bacterium]
MPAANPDAPVMTDVRMVGDAKRTRFVADLSANVEVTIFSLPDPYRVIVDLPEVTFRVPEGTGDNGRGLIKAFRYGQISPGKSRIVIDAGGPVAVDKSFVVPPSGGQPARLVIDVVPTSRKAFLDTAKAWREKEEVAAAAQRDRELVVPEKPPGGKLAIVLDPGHGGIDNGTHGATGIHEKDITLAFSKILGQKLVDTGLYDVFYTRTDDSFVSLSDRVNFARAHHADLFLSIHANSFPVKSVRGTTIYTVSDQPSDKMVADIASMENQSDALAGIDVDKKDLGEVKDILLDLTRRETRNFGVVFAQNLVNELKGSTRMFKVPHQQAAFIVLEAPDIPSAMIELGFVTNKDDEKLLLSDDWRQKAAGSVVNAVARFFKTHVARTP